MMESEWATHLMQFREERNSAGAYKFNDNDARYGIDLFKKAYPVSWTRIRLNKMKFPEEYKGQKAY